MITYPLTKVSIIYKVHGKKSHKINRDRFLATEIFRLIYWTFFYSYYKFLQYIVALVQLRFDGFDRARYFSTVVAYFIFCVISSRKLISNLLETQIRHFNIGKTNYIDGLIISKRIVLIKHTKHGRDEFIASFMDLSPLQLYQLHVNWTDIRCWLVQAMACDEYNKKYWTNLEFLHKI